MLRYAIILIFISKSFSQNLIKKGNELIQINNSNDYEIIIEDISKIQTYKTFLVNKNFQFLNRSSGIVYQLEGDTIVRIDKSYDDKMHNGSLDFVYKDTLYRFGGYGYFHTHKTLTYFDSNSKQWDLVKYEGFDLIKGFSGVGFHFIFDQKLYVFGYDTQVNQFQNESNLIRKGFVYDLREKEIEKTFKIHDSFIFPSSYYDVNDKYIFMFKNSPSKDLLIFNKETFSFSKHNLNVSEIGIVNLKDDNFTVLDNKLYYITKNIFNTLEINHIDIEDVLNKNDDLDIKLIDNKFSSYIYVFLIVLVIILIVVYRSYYSKFFIIHDSIVFRGKKLVIDERTRKIIIHLIKNEFSSNHEINDIFLDSGLNIIHINRFKNRCIKQINLDFRNKFKTDLIKKNLSLEDKRIIIFRLNPKFNFIIKN